MEITQTCNNWGKLEFVAPKARQPFAVRRLPFATELNFFVKRQNQSANGHFLEY
jgi:hypothetical protein